MRAPHRGSVAPAAGPLRTGSGDGGQAVLAAPEAAPTHGCCARERLRRGIIVTVTASPGTPTASPGPVPAGSAGPPGPAAGPPSAAAHDAATPTAGTTDRLLTVPNLLSALRLAGVPVFLWLVLGPHADGAALLLLMGSGVSDYLDGKLARALGQVSRVGAVLDPLADRLYIVSTIIALALRHIVPWELTGALLARDLVLLASLPVLARLGYGLLPVHFLGKAATFNLLYAFPLLLATGGSGWLATVARPLGWAFAAWGLTLYWWAGALYWLQVYQLRRAAGTGHEAAA